MAHRARAAVRRRQGTGHERAPDRRTASARCRGVGGRDRQWSTRGRHRRSGPRTDGRMAPARGLQRGRAARPRNGRRTGGVDFVDLHARVPGPDRPGVLRSPQPRAAEAVVEDRLSKIRNCLDIDGVRQTLELLAPEIDPRLLVRARAAGLSLDRSWARHRGISRPTGSRTSSSGPRRARPPFSRSGPRCWRRSSDATWSS